MDKRKKQNKRRSSVKEPPPKANAIGTRPRLFDQMAQPMPIPAPTNRRGANEIMLPIAVQAKPHVKKPKRKDGVASARRITRSEARRRRTGRRIFAAVMLVLLVGVGFVLSMTVLFKIEAFELDGESPYEIEEIKLAFAHPVGDNIFSFSIKDTQGQISEILPYIESVSVRRRLPGTVVFKVTPATETYYTATSGGFAVMSANLKILRISPDLPSGLIEIAGAEPISPEAGFAMITDNPEKQKALALVLAALKAEELSPITQIDIANELEISFLYDGRARVLIGTSNELKDKLALAKTILTENIGSTERGTLDVSHQSENQALNGVWRTGK